MKKRIYLVSSNSEKNVPGIYPVLYKTIQKINKYLLKHTRMYSVMYNTYGSRYVFDQCDAYEKR